MGGNFEFTPEVTFLKGKIFLSTTVLPKLLNVFSFFRIETNNLVSSFSWKIGKFRKL
jgi:hypothetical protein